MCHKLTTTALISEPNKKYSTQKPICSSSNYLKPCDDMFGIKVLQLLIRTYYGMELLVNKWVVISKHQLHDKSGCLPDL